MNKTNCININEIFENWLASGIDIKLKQSTISTYIRRYECYIKPFFGQYSPQELAQGKINDWIRILLENGSKSSTGALKANTVNDIITFFSALINFSGMETNYKLYRPTPIAKSIVVLSSEETRKLIDYCNSNLNYVTFGILLARFTGIRLGELCACTKRCLDLDNAILNVTKTLQRIKNLEGNGNKTKIIIDTPKSASSIRAIPLLNFIVEKMKLLYSNLENDDVFLLTGKTNKFIEPRRMEEKLKEVFEKAQISYKNFHVLRHTFATEFYEKTHDIKALSEILGHSNVNVTYEKYVHYNMEIKRKKINMLSDTWRIN